jgi:hypothetical protein
MPNKTVAFCRPGYQFSSQWVTCWTDLMFYCAQNGIAVIDRPAVFHNIHMVRDMALGVNMGHEGQQPFNGETDYTHIMWIDSDQVWHPAHFQKLLDADEDIVSGWYALNGTTGKGICTGWFDETTLLEKDGMPCLTKSELADAKRNEKGLIDLAAIHPEYGHPWMGLGFTLIKRGVFEKIPYPWFYDDCIKIGDIIANRGDDISFCRKAHEAGFRIYLHPEVRVGHEKSHVF